MIAEENEKSKRKEEPGSWASRIPTKLFIYGLVDPRDKRLRYVGQTAKGMVRPRQHWTPEHLKLQDECHKWVASLVEGGLKPEIIVLENVMSRGQLDEKEKNWIERMKAEGFDLLNMAEGGEGGAGRRPGFKHSEETRKKISEGMKRGREKGRF